MKKIKKAIKSKFAYKFIPTNARKFVEIDLDYVENSNLFAKGILLPDVKDAIVKVNIRVLAEDIHKVPIEEIVSALSGAYYVKKIVPKLVKEKVVRIKNLTIDSTPLESMQRYLEVKKPKDADDIRSKAELLMREVGVI